MTYNKSTDCSLKEIKTVNELLGIIAKKQSIFFDRNGVKYEFHIVRVLNCKLSELMEMIGNRLLFYDFTT